MKKFMFLALIVAGLFFVGCDDDNDDVSGGTGTLSVRLTDDPADYEEVWIDVQGLEINISSDSTDESGWQVLDLDTMGQINLLSLTNGQDVLLAEEDLAVGNIGQMRLLLGDNNEIVVDGTTHPLKTPSGQQSGLKFNIHATIEAGVPYKMWIDFDVSKSIVEKGNGTYSLKPTIKVFTEESGGIEGVVDPMEERSLVEAIMDGDTTSTYTDTITGGFMILGLDAGIYKVLITPDDDYMPKDTTGVEVVTGLITDIETIKLDTIP